MTTLILTGVVLVCVGFIFTKLVKRLRKRTQTQAYCAVYAPSPSYVSDHLVEEEGSGPTHDTVETSADADKKSSYISVQS